MIISWAPYFVMQMKIIMKEAEKESDWLNFSSRFNVIH